MWARLAEPQSREARSGRHPPRPTPSQVGDSGERRAAGSQQTRTPARGWVIGHTLSLIQRQALNFLLVQSPARLGWADKQLMNEEGRQSGSQKETHRPTVNPTLLLGTPASGGHGPEGGGADWGRLGLHLL